MAFDYLEPRIPARVKSTFPKQHLRMHEEEIRYRAALLRRLGRDQDTAVARCLAHLAWGYDLAGRSPVTEDEVRRIVGQVYR